MPSLPPACPRCRSNDASLLSTEEAFVNDPPEDGEHPLAIVAVFMCDCGNVYTDVQRPMNSKP